MFSTEVIVLAGLLLLVGTTIPGVRLYWPRRTDPVSRSDLGVALMGGALIAFAVLVLQLMIQIRTEADARDRQEQAERQSLLLLLGRSPNLAGLDLSEEDLEGAYLNEKVLRGANLAKAKMEEASLQDAILVAANLAAAQLDRAHLDRADLRYADLAGASLTGATLNGVRLDAATLSPRRDGDNVVRADLSRADLTNAWVRANLSGAVLKDAILVGARLAPANLEGADLTGADVEFADFRGANLKGANLEHVRNLDVAKDLSLVQYDRATRWPRGYTWQGVRPAEACKAATCELAPAARPVRDLDPALRPMHAALEKTMTTSKRACLPGWWVDERTAAIDAHAPRKRATFTISTTPRLDSAESVASLFDIPRSREIRGIAVRRAADTHAERFELVEGNRRETVVAVYFVDGRTGFRMWGRAPTDEFPLFKRDFVKLFSVLGVDGDLFAELRGGKDGCGRT